MKTKMALRARVVGIAVAAALLASCYAPLADQKGHLNLSLAAAGPPSVVAPTTAIVMVVDSDYQASLAELLNLVSKGHKSQTIGGPWSSSDADRLKTLGKQLVTNGLVSFGGYPFYQANLTSATGSFDIPGVPAGKSYLVKFFVLTQNTSFTVQDIDQGFSSLIQSENLVFTTESWTSRHGMADLEHCCCWPNGLSECGCVRHSPRCPYHHYSLTGNIARPEYHQRRG